MSRKWFDNKIPNYEKVSNEKVIHNFADKTVTNYINNFNSNKLDLAANDVEPSN